MISSFHSSQIFSKLLQWKVRSKSILVHEPIDSLEGLDDLAVAQLLHVGAEPFFALGVEMPGSVVQRQISQHRDVEFIHWQQHRARSHGP